jgi:hypothetical protein
MQIYIIFHKYIFDECYKGISKSNLNKYFTFIAVNKKIKKYYTPDKYKVIKEWNLPHYRNEFQELGYNENSAIYHVYANNLHKPYNYVGFFQYDMIFNNDVLQNILTRISQPSPVYFHIGLNDYTYCTLTTWNESATADYIVNDYETFFFTKFNKDARYPLWNSYIIPINMYEKIMSWVIQLIPKMYPWCIESPNKEHFGHIGGIYERVMAFAIGQEQIEEILLPIKHDHRLKNKSY